MADVLVTVPRAIEQGVDGPLGALYRYGHTVRHVRANAQTTASELIAALAGASAVVAIIEPYTKEVFAGAPLLRHIARVGVGYDAVDVAEATKHGVLVTNTPGANSTAVADFAMGMLLAVARWIPTFDRDIRQVFGSLSWAPMRGNRRWVSSASATLLAASPDVRVASTCVSWRTSRIRIWTSFETTGSSSCHSSSCSPKAIS